MEQMSSLANLIEYLEVGDYEYIHNYLIKARELSFSSTDRKQILILADNYKDKYHEMGSLLANLAFNTLDEELMGDIEVGFSSWNISMRQASLQYLDRLCNVKATELYANLLIKHKDEIKEIPFEYSRQDKQLLYKFLTKIEECFNSEHLKEAIYSLALDITNTASLTYLNTLRENLIADLIISSASLSKYRHQYGDNWMWNHVAYQNTRRISCLLLDLAGRIGDENFVSALRSFMRINDMKIRFYAAMAILRLNGQVRKSDFAKISQSSETRNALYKTLSELGQLDKFPINYISSEFFAEGDMVEWLVNNKMFARVPDEIELVCIFDTEDGDQKYEWYLFKFKTNYVEYAHKNFMSGIAGPYLKNAPPGASGGDLSVSCFESFSSKSLQEHIEQMFSVLKSRI